MLIEHLSFILFEHMHRRREKTPQNFLAKENMRNK